MGEACQKYLSKVSSAMKSANAVHGKSHSAKHAPDTAKSGGYVTGVGNQRNIVVSQGVYDQALKRVQIIDSRMAEEIYKMTVQIERMCETTYIVPETRAKCLEYVDKIKSSLGKFESLTDEAIICTRQLASTLLSLGGVDAGFGYGSAFSHGNYAGMGDNTSPTVFNADSMETIRSETEKDMNDQIGSLEASRAQCLTQAASLEQSASNMDRSASQLEYVAATAMKTEYYTDHNGNRQSREVPDGDKRAAASRQAADLRKQAAAMREQAAAMREQAARLADQIANLQGALADSNADMRDLGEDAQQTDLCHAGKLDSIIDDTESYINDLGAICDGIPIPLNELVDQIIQGDWKNWPERESLLTDAGYDYNTVQAEVNKRLEEEKKYGAYMPESWDRFDKLSAQELSDRELKRVNPGDLPPDREAFMREVVDKHLDVQVKSAGDLKLNLMAKEYNNALTRYDAGLPYYESTRLGRV